MNNYAKYMPQKHNYKRGTVISRQKVDITFGKRRELCATIQSGKIVYFGKVREVQMLHSEGKDTLWRYVHEKRFESYSRDNRDGDARWRSAICNFENWNAEVRTVRSTRRLLRYRFNLSLLLPPGTNLIATTVNYYDRKLRRNCKAKRSDAAAYVAISISFS